MPKASRKKEITKIKAEINDGSEIHIVIHLLVVYTYFGEVTVRYCGEEIQN